MIVLSDSIWYTTCTASWCDLCVFDNEYACLSWVALVYIWDDRLCICQLRGSLAGRAGASNPEGTDRDGLHHQSALGAWR